MKFEKKLVVLSGDSFAKGTLSLERNAFGVFATFNIYNLPDLNEGEYAAGVKNSLTSFKRKLGSLGRIMIRFKLEDTELDGLHCVIFDTVNEEPLLYGTTASQRLWDGNMMDGFRERRSGAGVAVQTVNALPNDIGGYFLDILQRGDAGYCDTAVAAVNYYPQDMNIEVTYSGRENQPPVVNPLDEAVRKRNEPVRTARPQLEQAEESDGVSDAAVESEAERFLKTDSNADKSEKADAVSREKASEPIGGGNSEGDIKTGGMNSKAGDEGNVKGREAKDADGTKNITNKGLEQSEGTKTAVCGQNGDGTGRGAETSRETASLKDSAQKQAVGGADAPRETVSLKGSARLRPSCETDGGADFVIFEPPLKRDSLAGNGGGDGNVGTEKGYENTTRRADENKAAANTETRRMSGGSGVNVQSHSDKSVANGGTRIGEQRTADTSGGMRLGERRSADAVSGIPSVGAGAEAAQIRVQSVASAEAAATVPPASKYTADKAVNSTVTKIIFYELVKSQIDELFATYPPFEQLEKMMPDTKWVKVDYDGNGKFYVVGLIGSNPDYLCYGVPSHYNPTPPKDLDGYCQWLPLDPEKPEGDGFWLMFQDAVSGESVSGKA